MTRIPITTILPAGVEATFAPIEADVEYKFRNVSKNCHIAIRNEGEADIHIEFRTQRMFDELTIKNRSVMVKAGTSKVIGPFMPSVFNTPQKDIICSFTGDGGISVAVFSV